MNETLMMKIYSKRNKESVNKTEQFFFQIHTKWKSW